MITNKSHPVAKSCFCLARTKKITIITAVAITVSGCTHLSVVPDRFVTERPSQALSGVSYALPMLQYDVAVTRTLTACPELVKIEGDNQGRTFWRGAVAVELTATATPNQVAGERYMIDYSKLDGALKTTNFAIEYQPGTEILKAVNVSVEDHSGEVAGNVVKAGIAVATVAAGPAGPAVIGAATLVASAPLKSNNFKSLLSQPLADKLDALIRAQEGGDAQSAFKAALQNVQAEREISRAELIALIEANTTQKTMLTCSATASIDAAKRKALADTLENDGKKLKTANATLETLTKLAAVRGLTKEGQQELGEAAKQVLTLAKDVETSQASLATVDKRLGASTHVAWPESFVTHDTKEFSELSTEQKDKLVRLLGATPVTIQLIDAQRLADALARRSKEQLAGFRTIAKEFVDSYVNDDNTAKRFADEPKLAGCSNDGAAAVDPRTCVTSMTKLSAALQPVKSDFLPDCPTQAPECRTTLDAKKQTERSDFPRQVSARDVTPRPGLFVRPPARAQLTICRLASQGETTTPMGCADKAQNLVKDDKVLAPQLGQLRFFRLVNQMFSNNGLSLSLTKEGAIEKFQYASSKSIAQGLAAAAADAANQAAAFDKQRREEYLKNTDPTALLQKQIAFKEATDKLASLYADPTPDPMKAVALAKAQAEVELIRAQINALEAQSTAAAARPLD